MASSITSVTGGVAAGWILPVEVLMKSAPAIIASQRPAIVVGLQLACLEDHLQVRALPVGSAHASRTATISSKASM